MCELFSPPDATGRFKFPEYHTVKLSIPKIFLVSKRFSNIFRRIPKWVRRRTGERFFVCLCHGEIRSEMTQVGWMIKGGGQNKLPMSICCRSRQTDYQKCISLRGIMDGIYTYIVYGGHARDKCSRRDCQDN